MLLSVSLSLYKINNPLYYLHGLFACMYVSVLPDIAEARGGQKEVSWPIFGN